MMSLSPTDIKTLEQLRLRLSQLTTSLASLQQQLLHSSTLPPWPSLQTISSIISNNLSSLSNHLAASAPLLSSLSIYPTPAYPGRDQAPLLSHLLRKKLEPSVEEWVESGRAEAKTIENNREAVEEFWHWAMLESEELKRSLGMAELGVAEFTVEEEEQGLEGVETGLRGTMRGIEVEEEEEDRDGDEEKKRERKGKQPEEVPPMGIDEMLRFMTRGEVK